MVSYSDYPEAVRKAAKSAIERNAAVGNRCATQVGKVRGQQLAQGKPVSEETVRRMHSYLSRAEEYYDPKKPMSCGTISYDLWGGKAALKWTEKKLKQMK